MAPWRPRRNGKRKSAPYGQRQALPASIAPRLMIPVMNGWECLAAIAKRPVLRGIPVVVADGRRDAQVTGGESRS